MRAVRARAAARVPPRAEYNEVMAFVLRLATPDDVGELLPRTRALNAQEAIVIDDVALEAALRRLLTDASLGAVWLIEGDGRPVGYLVVTYGYDLEFGGRDAYLTELWVDADARGRGAGTAALAALDGELRSRDVAAVHLQVRPGNPAVRIYERAGWRVSPRLVM